RRLPRTLNEAATKLAEASGLASSDCEIYLQQLLLKGGELKRPDGGRVFAFKIHQFISQGHTLFATLESPGNREFSLEGQRYAEGQRLLVPLRFCRQCGQDYYHVLRRQDGS